MAAADPSLSLLAYGDVVAGCERCALAATRTQVVFGSGSPNADLMFVGEAPGFHEDKQGVPFVGAAGQLLSKLLAGIGLTRDDVYIANVLKCRPPGNRDPQPGEIEACEAHLFKQIELIRPKVVATLGNFATKLLSGKPDGITRVHGVPQEVVARRQQGRALPDLPSRPRRSTRRGCSRCSKRTSAACRSSLGRATVARPRRAHRRRSVAPAEPSASAVSSSACSSALAPLLSLAAATLAARGRGERSAEETESLGGASWRRGSRRGDVVAVSRRARARGRRRSCAGRAGRSASRSPSRARRSRSATATTAPIPVAHLDLYRLAGIDPEEWGDLEPYFDGTIAFVEWPEHGGNWLPEARVAVTLSHVDQVADASRSPMRTILAFDTATSVTSCALVRDGALVAERATDARSLLAATDELLADAGLEPPISTASSSAPARAASPRSGWGSRPPAASASRSALPVAGVSTLLAFAGGDPVIDAKRGEVFATGPVVARPEELAVAGRRLVGDGAVRYRAVFEAAGAEIPPDDDPAHSPHAHLLVGPRRRLRPGAGRRADLPASTRRGGRRR